MVTTAISPALYEVDPNTGAATKIASTDLGLITITNLNGAVYGFDGLTGQVVTLDVTNGNTSVVSDIDSALGLIGGAAAIGSAAAVPEPASMTLAGFGVAALLLRTRRRRHSTISSKRIQPSSRCCLCLRSGPWQSCRLKPPPTALAVEPVAMQMLGGERFAERTMRHGIDALRPEAYVAIAGGSEI